MKYNFASFFTKKEKNHSTQCQITRRQQKCLNISFLEGLRGPYDGTVLHGVNATHMYTQIYKGTENKTQTQEREYENSKSGESQQTSWMQYPDAQKGQSP